MASAPVSPSEGGVVSHLLNQSLVFTKTKLKTYISIIKNVDHVAMFIIIIIINENLFISLTDQIKGVSASSVPPL